MHHEEAGEDGRVHHSQLETPEDQQALAGLLGSVRAEDSALGADPQHALVS